MSVSSNSHPTQIGWKSVPGQNKPSMRDDISIAKSSETPLAAPVSLGSSGSPRARQFHTGQPASLNKTPVSSQPLNTWAHGVELRTFLLSGTLSSVAQHALIHMPQLRRGLVGSPVPDEIRHAILNEPLSQELRPILMDELQKQPDASQIGSSESRAEGKSRLEADRPSQHPADHPASVDTTPTTAMPSQSPAAGTRDSGSDAPPLKKVFTMRRNNVPERPSLLSLISISSGSPSISRAPFKPLPPDSPTVLQTARIVSDVLPEEFTQTHDLTKDADTTGSITGILRDISGDSQGVKRKRVEDFASEFHGSSKSWEQTSTSSSSEQPSVVASGPLLNGRKFQKNQDDLQPLSFLDAKSKLKGVSPVESDDSLSISNRVNLAQEQLMHPTSRATQPKAMRERKNTPVYNLKKLTYDHGKHYSKAEGPHTAVDRGREVSLSSITSTRSPADDMDVVSPDILQASQILVESSEDEEYDDMGDADDETDVEELRTLATSTPQRTAPTELTAENDRPYNRWHSTNGRHVLSHGALLPTNYKPRPDLENPWICPIRTCRVMFSTLDGLGSHFNRRHRRTLLNDNSDGTLSVIRVRDKGANGKMPAVVVSKNPLDPEEPPMAEPSFSANTPKIHKKVSKGRFPKASSSELKSRRSLHSMSEEKRDENQESLDAAKDGDPIEDDDAAMSMWKLVHPHLRSTPFYPIPVKGYVPELLILPLVREIEFNPLAPNKYFESRPQDIGALIMQITGHKAQQPCKRCQEGRGPFKGCVVISPDAPLWARRLVTGCANCFYKSNQTYCDLKTWSRKTYPELSDPTISSAPPVRSSQHATGNATISEEKKNISKQRPTRVFANPSSSAAKSAKRQSERRVAVSDPGVRDTPKGNEGSPSQPTRHGVDASKSRSTAVEHDSTLELSMEDWEIAPGRIRNESSENIENIAFSAAYLAHSEEVSVARDVGFHVLVVKPGTAHRFQSMGDRMRLCSIATGKVKVKTLGQVFDVGPNGMFQVKAGKTCVVENRLYGDATLHITAFPSDFPE